MVMSIFLPVLHQRSRIRWKRFSEPFPRHFGELRNIFQNQIIIMKKILSIKRILLNSNLLFLDYDTICPYGPGCRAISVYLHWNDHFFDDHNNDGIYSLEGTETTC